MANKQDVPAESFVDIIKANVDNVSMSDNQFRAFIRNTLPVVESRLDYPKDVQKP